MALDAICLTAVVEELRRTLEGGKIDKIYQPSRDEVVMAIRGAGENVKLLHPDRKSTRLNSSH